MKPAHHVASSSIVVPRDAASIYKVIRDVANAPSWRPDVKKVEVLAAAKFREHGKNGVVTYDIETDEPPRRLVTRIADTNLGYGGSWTYELADVPEGTRVTITENGFVTNVFFRVMMRLFFKPTSSIERYLAALRDRGMRAKG